MFITNVNTKLLEIYSSGSSSDTPRMASTDHFHRFLAESQKEENVAIEEALVIFFEWSIMASSTSP